MSEQSDDFADWPHVCAECGELLEPTIHVGDVVGHPQQWLHLNPQAGHAPDPRLLPPEDE